MNKINSRIIIPLTSIILGTLWFFLGLTKYGWWTEKGPGSGFFPTIIGGLLIIIGSITFFSEKKIKSPEFTNKSFFPLIAAICTILLALLIGFFPALFIYLIYWLKFFEKYSLKTTIITSTCTIAISYFVFSYWLCVPFPKGIIYNFFF